MPDVTVIESLDDPRIACYRNLKDRELARLENLFIAEGELLVRRLLASDYAVESVLLAEHQVQTIAPLVRPGVSVYAASTALVNQIVGFGFHSGVMAVGRRRPTATIDELALRWGPRATLLVLPEVNKTDNLGSMLRLAAGFGVDGVILGERCCDPFYRQAVRVSMGAVFTLGIVQSVDLTADLRRLRHDHGFELAGTVLDERAVALPSADRPERLALLMGNEAQGLSPQHIALCDRTLTIPMKLGTDSLNVAVAAGIFLYHFTMLCNSR